VELTYSGLGIPTGSNTGNANCRNQKDAGKLFSLREFDSVRKTKIKFASYGEWERKSRNRDIRYLNELVVASMASVGRRDALKRKVGCS
jgi:hypothetical protein